MANEDGAAPEPAAATRKDSRKFKVALVVTMLVVGFAIAVFARWVISLVW